MTIPRPRLTVRRLMIAVALAGVALGGLILLHRRREYALAMADRHTEQCTVAISAHLTASNDRRLERSIEHHMILGEKWQAAADRPWLPFETDPPEPE